MSTRIRGVEYYTVQDLKDILPIDHQTITRYIVAGKIKGIKIGVKWYVSRIELDRFLDARYNDIIKRCEKAVQS